MRLSSHKSSRARMIVLDMTPMIDVVFLLLIFFLVTTSFVQAERQLDPATRVESAARAVAADFEPAIVEVRAGGAGFVYRLGGREFTDPAELSATLSQFPQKSEGAFVRVSDEAPYGMGAVAVQAARDAGFLVVSYIPAERDR